MNNGLPPPPPFLVFSSLPPFHHCFLLSAHCSALVILRCTFIVAVVALHFSNCFVFPTSTFELLCLDEPV
jgi:hypothetical protein